VGHETDFSISDFAADVRAPTPSAAAEMVVRSKEDFQERVSMLTERLARSASHSLRELRGRVERISTHQAFAAVIHGIELKGQRVDEALHRSRSLVERRVAGERRRIEELARRLGAKRVDRRLGEAKARLGRLLSGLQAAERQRVDRLRRSFAGLAAKLDALSPLEVLGRGYSLAWSPQGKLLRVADDVSVGERVRVDLHRGSLHCRVEEVETETETETETEDNGRPDEQ
jgi:exodeoxyribonuclease VII large subunit